MTSKRSRGCCRSKAATSFLLRDNQDGKRDNQDGKF